MVYKGIIIDDEATCISELIELSEQSQQLKIVGFAMNIKDGIDLVLKENPDVIFLDVQLQDGTGFDLLKEIGDIKFKIIFVTAYEQYALQAIKFSALDYLLKPVTSKEFTESIERLINVQASENNVNLKVETLLSNLKADIKGDKKIFLRSNDCIHIVNVQDIMRCQAENNYTEFCLVDGKKILISKTLKEYEKLLSPFGFYRLHVSHLVNFNYIENINKKNGYVLMKDKSKVPFSLKGKDKLMLLLEAL